MADGGEPVDDGGGRIGRWPLVPDADSVFLRLRQMHKRIARLYVLIVALILCQALAMSGVLWKLQADDRSRSARFCLLTQQAVNAATPDKPIDPILIAAAEATGCQLRLPAVLRIS